MFIHRKMQNTEMPKTHYTGQEFMNLFFKKNTPEVVSQTPPISQKPPLTKLKMKISANLAYPGMFRKNNDKKPILTIRREIN